MGKKLFVGGIPFSTSQEALSEAFSKAGTVVSVNLIMDRETARPRGFGFVEMATDEEAAAAIEMFDGKEFEGRVLAVKEARPQQPRQQHGGGMRGGDRGSRGGGSRW